jgi:lipoprotein signal peptidase
MLGSMRGFKELIVDMIDVEVYKCKEKIKWPSFTLFDVYPMIEF